MNFAATRSHVAEPDKTGGRSTTIVGAGEKWTGSGTAMIALDEVVGSITFLHACYLPSQDYVEFFEIRDEADTADLLGFYHIIY